MAPNTTFTLSIEVSNQTVVYKDIVFSQMLRRIVHSYGPDLPNATLVRLLQAQIDLIKETDQDG